MAKPIVKAAPALSFDEDNTISFVWNGNSIKSVEIAVKVASTNNTVYSNTVATALFAITIPQGSITSSTGYNYTIEIRVTENISGVVSEWSDKSYVFFMNPPEWSFENVPSRIDSTYYKLNVTYFEVSGEPLSSYYFVLYDSSRTQISKTDVSYNTSDISYTLDGLDIGTYYIQAVGETVHGYPLDTGLVMFTVGYEKRDEYALMYVDNIAGRGVITYKTNVVSIRYRGDAEFEFFGSEIFLDDDPPLIYDEGFSISGDFLLALKCRDVYRTAEMLKLRNDMDDSVILSSHVYDDGSLRFKMRATNGVQDYVLYTDALADAENDSFIILIKRVNNAYELRCKRLPMQGKELNAIYIGSTFKTTYEETTDWIYDDIKNVDIPVNQVDMRYESEEPSEVHDNVIWLLT